jgi:tetratricopeptide (TPR) repeat protein/TolB-like protein
LRNFATSALLVYLLALPGLASAQLPGTSSKTLVILPFENTSKAPGIEWIGEAFPEVLEQRITTVYVMPRADRLYAFERLGIPANLHPSRATLYRIAQEMDADYMVVGSYSFDGHSFMATAQVLDMGRLRLSPPVFEGGPLTNLLEIANGVAWDVLQSLPHPPALSRRDFVATAPVIRLDAFENYIRALTDTSRADKIHHLRESLRLSPGYTLAILELGKAYYEDRDYPAAASWLERIPHDQRQAREANFYLGLSCYYMGDFQRAEEAFRFVAEGLPLTQVYNNLGVVAGRRGEKSEIDYFQKAVQADPKDADYRFNLGIALVRSGDNAGAIRQLKEAVALRPSDREARTLLDSLAIAAPRNSDAAPGVVHAGAMVPRLPLARIKRDYEEWQFRELALEIQNINEMKMASQPPRIHAQFHIDRGNQMLAQGFSEEAEREFREAIALDPTLAAAHVGLASVLERRNPAGARAECQAAIRLQPSAEAYVLLTRLDLKENRLEAAGDDLTHALALEPANAAALALKRDLDARTGTANKAAQP